MPAKKEIDLEKFKKLFEEGVSTEELCKIFNITKSSVNRAKLKCGYITKKFKRLKEKITQEELYDLFANQRMTLNEIANHYNEKRSDIIELLAIYDINQKERKLDIPYKQLYQDYKIDKMSYEQISKKYNISVHEVTEKIKEYKFEPNHFTGYISKEELYDLYIIQNKRKEEIAKRFGCSDSKISEYLAEYDIKKDPDMYHKLAKETCMNKYGVENAGWTEESQKKIKKTNREKFGKDFYIQTAEFKEKSKQTCLERYGVEHIGYNVKEINNKIKQTNIKKYGSEYPIQNISCKEKRENTNIMRYGSIHVTQCKEIKEKAKQTCLQRYGVDNPIKLKEIHKKLQNTNFELYGHEHALQVREFEEKRENTMLKRYGVKNSMESEEFKRKAHETMKANGSFSRSAPEDKIFELLQQKFPKTIRQYHSDLYPFNCDFYIPEIDTYIEYQGYVCHGKEPYDPLNESHIKKVKELERRAEIREAQINKSSQYRKIIKIWTISDPLKRKIARDNNLNWLEFFTFKEFEAWYTKL